MTTGFETLHEIVKAARGALADGDWDYLVGGTETETTLRRNRLALDSLGFRPRVLRDVREIDCSATFLGNRMRLPVLLAPIGSLQALHADGALAAAKAAEAFGVMSVLSSVTEPGLEAVAAGTSHPKMYQLYVRGDLNFVEDYVRRAVDNGYEAFCLTVDTAIYSRRERDIIKRFAPPARRTRSGMAFQAGLTWDLVDWVKANCGLPLAIKGIATAEDATRAVEHGVDVVYVSNHGGRQLDHGRGAIDVLPEVVDAVSGRATVVVDGGFLRGTDVVKAIALGADAVGIGRLYGYGMAAAGAAGVERVLEILEIEVRTALGLLGVCSLNELDAGHVCAAPPVHAPSALSAFPFLDIDPIAY
jgi:isopentenyl diphosphate isomerase/L-lactate dehydrogenase-like FMN-dependent dehydrogenase